MERIGDEASADVGGAITTLLGETVAKRSDAARQIAHEGRRFVTQRNRKLPMIAPSHDAFVEEPLQERAHLGFARAVRGAASLIFSARPAARCFQAPQQRADFAVAGSVAFFVSAACSRLARPRDPSSSPATRGLRYGGFCRRLEPIANSLRRRGPVPIPPTRAPCLPPSSPCHVPPWSDRSPPGAALDELRSRQPQSLLTRALQRTPSGRPASAYLR